MDKKRNNIIDAIKGVAILSVVAFHLGWFKWGYWGVDVFYVIAGYFAVRGMRPGFLKARIGRLLPTMVAAIAVCFILGVCFYLPIQMMDICRTAVTSCLFVSNFDLWRTANDYWATSNELNPMMHFWYLATLVQFYAVLAVLYWRGEKTWTKFAIGAAGVVSFGLCVFSIGDAGMRYYLLPWRFWEFAIGVALFWWPSILKPFSRMKGDGAMCRILAIPGMMSFSIYVWHQPIFAFVRYMYERLFSPMTIVAMLVALAVVSWLSFRCLERKIVTKPGRMALVTVYGIVLLGAAAVYFNSGVSHGIPELGFDFGRYERGFIYKYNDRIRAFTDDFKHDEGIKVLLVGDSYARDWGNVLLESSASNRIDLVYGPGDKPKTWLKLIDDADVIFFSAMLPTPLPQSLETDRTWVIGTKYYGFSGWVYTRRFTAGYHDIAIELPDDIRERNLNDKKRYGDRFIDMIGMAQNDDGRVRCFTDDGKFFTIDYGHLSSPGAQCYARMIEKNGILERVLLNSKGI